MKDNTQIMYSVVFMFFGGWGGGRERAKDFLFKSCVSQVNKVILDSLPCQQLLGESLRCCIWQKINNCF